MAATATILRNLLAVEIIAKQQEDFFTFNNFDVEQVWIPEEEVEDLVKDHPYGKLYIIASPWDEGPNLSRHSSLALREIPISLGFQKGKVLTSDTAGIDLLVDLIDGLYEVCRELEHDDYTWLRTESLKDANGVPFNYNTMANHNVFSAYFTCYYNHIVQ